MVLVVYGCKPPSDPGTSMPECGDGVHEVGEVCYASLATGREGVDAYGVSLGSESALVLVDLPATGTDASIEIAQVQEGQLVTVVNPLVVVDSTDLFSFASVDLKGSGQPQIVARTLTSFSVFSIVNGTLTQEGTVMSHPQAPYSGGPFLHGDVDGNGVEELFFHNGRIARLLENDIELLAEVPIGGCGTVRAGRAGDLNNDGYIDFVAVGSIDEAGVDCAGMDSYDPEQHRATVVMGGPEPASLGVSTEFGPGVIPIEVVSGDYDGDGDLDLAFSGPDGSRIFLGQGDGTFGDATVLALDAASVLHLRHAGDVDGDGVDELVAVVAETNDFGIVDDVLGAPQFQLLAPSEVYLSSAASDFNNDGQLDFALFRGRTAELVLLLSEP